MNDKAKNISLLVCLSTFLFCILCACINLIIYKIYLHFCFNNLINRNEERKIVAECYLDNNNNNNNLKTVEAIPI
jgi:hypothetical protein